MQMGLHYHYRNQSYRDAGDDQVYLTAKVIANARESKFIGQYLILSLSIIFKFIG